MLTKKIKEMLTAKKNECKEKPKDKCKKKSKQNKKQRNQSKSKYRQKLFLVFIATQFIIHTTVWLSYSNQFKSQKIYFKAILFNGQRITIHELQ